MDVFRHRQQPDYSEWRRRQLWTLIEAACLLSGIEPVPPERFSNHSDTAGTARGIYTDLKDAIELKQLTFIESRDGYIRGRRVKPDECVTWAAGRGYAIPVELSDLKKRNPAETRDERKVRLRRWIAEEKEKGTKAWLQAVARREGVHPSRVKELVRPAPAVNKVPSVFPGVALPLSKPSPTKRRDKY